MFSVTLTALPATGLSIYSGCEKKLWAGVLQVVLSKLRTPGIIHVRAFSSLLCDPFTSQYSGLCILRMDLKTQPPLSYPGGSFAENVSLGHQMGRCVLEINSTNSPKCNRLYPVIVYQCQAPGLSQNCTLAPNSTVLGSV